MFHNENVFGKNEIFQGSICRNGPHDFNNEFCKIHKRYEKSFLCIPKPTDNDLILQRSSKFQVKLDF